MSDGRGDITKQRKGRPGLLQKRAGRSVPAFICAAFIPARMHIGIYVISGVGWCPTIFGSAVIVLLLLSIGSPGWVMQG